MMKRIIAYSLLTSLFYGIYHFGKPLWYPYYIKLRGRKTVAEVIKKIGPANERELKLIFSKKNLSYPPKGVKLIGLKEEKVLQVYGFYNGDYTHVYDIKILAASGKAGPKLKEGDRQVPEGIYKIAGLNPNSSFHLSIKLNYPNEFDRVIASHEGRVKLGDNIFIHGKNASIGCLAIGDPEVEKLFTLIHKVGKKNVHVVIAPYDFRKREFPVDSNEWVEELYKNVKRELI